MSTRSSVGSSATPDPAARQALRSGTRAAHEEVDRLFGGFDLRAEDGYRRFLLAHAAAFLPVEAGLNTVAPQLIADWPARRRGERLVADLADLEATAPASLPCLPASPAAAWGMLYVLEGSRLGGALLAREVPAPLPRSYLAGEAAPGAWRSLLASLDKSLYDASDLRAAVTAALQVFHRFAEAARCYLDVTAA